MGPDFVKWPHAIKFAIVSIYKDKVLDLIDHPKGVKCIGHTWRYKDTDIDVHICKIFDLSERNFIIKFKELNLTRFDLP
jgi:hypothetical protein